MTATPSATPTPIEAIRDGFTQLGLDPRLVAVLTKLGYEEPTPIQQEAIPRLLEGVDMVGQAATGTGKTAAFALPLIQRLLKQEGKRNKPSALILVPTRELCMQVAEAIYKYGGVLGVSVLPIYGGQAYEQQIRALKRGVDVIVATPGRALDHVRRGTLVLATVTTVVLDEADEMLDMGFVDDIETLLSGTSAERQVVLFSATMAPRIASIAKRHLRDPVRIKIERQQVKSGDVPKVRQTAYIVGRSQKIAALTRVLDLECPTSALIFCRTRMEVDELQNALSARGHRAEPMHGGMSQQQRERVIKKLRSGQAELVIATDVAARGLDIEQLSHVINYDVPAYAEAYVHRIGRVGRAGREGVAITLAEPREHRLLRNIELQTKQKIEVGKVPTVADLRTRRLEMTRAALREILVEAEHERFRVVVEALSTEFDPMDIAMAAVKLAHKTSGADDESAEEIVSPAVFDRRERVGAERGGGPRTFEKRPPRSGGGGPRSASAGMSRVYIGTGRTAGVRPQDLVGAITGEAGITGREVGAIDIGDRFSIVEIADELVDGVIEALRGAKIKGKSVMVRRDRM